MATKDLVYLQWLDDPRNGMKGFFSAIDGRESRDSMAVKQF